MRTHEEASEPTGGFEASFFERLSKLESGFWWFESRNDLIAWALKKWAPGADSMLEIGCGTGYVLGALANRFPAIDFTGSDFFDKGLAFARQRTPRATFLQMDARQMPFKEEFDVIGAFDVIEHIDQDERVLSEMRAALKPGGIVLITVPQHQFLWSAADSYAHHERRYERSDLRRKLIAANLEPIAIRSFVSLLLPLQLAARLRPAQYDPEAEFRISTTMNRALRWIMGVEASMIRAGASFPYGGSLLAVARAV